MSAFARGDRVVVTEFVRRGDREDLEELDGWLVQMTDRTVTIASTPDWEHLEFEKDYFTATYLLDQVIVSPFNRATADAGAISVVTVIVLGIFTLFITGLACALFGALGHSFPLFAGGLILAITCWWIGALLLEGHDEPMKLSTTRDGIPVIELSEADLAGPAPAEFTAAVTGFAARVEGQADLDCYEPIDPKGPGYADRLADLADGRD